MGAMVEGPIRDSGLNKFEAATAAAVSWWSTALSQESAQNVDACAQTLARPNSPCGAWDGFFYLLLSLLLLPRRSYLM